MHYGIFVERSENMEANQPVITFTDAAVEQVKKVVEEYGDPELKLRLFIQGGGCSGFQYGFNLEDSVSEDDLVVEKGGATFLVDPLSLPYLVGATVDYTVTPTQSQFTITNPNAERTCGCGSSFGA